MPWTGKDSTRHTKKAKSAIAKRQWAHVADSALKRGESEVTAIREANGVIKKRTKNNKARFKPDSVHHRA